MNMLTKDEAKLAVIAQSYESTCEESSDFGRRLHHCFMSFTGCDWDEHAVLAKIDEATEMAWVDTWLGACLVVIADGKRYTFDTVKAPASMERTQL